VLQGERCGGGEGKLNVGKGHEGWQSDRVRVCRHQSSFDVGCVFYLGESTRTYSSNNTFIVVCLLCTTLLPLCCLACRLEWSESAHGGWLALNKGKNQFTEWNNLLICSHFFNQPTITGVCESARVEWKNLTEANSESFLSLTPRHKWRKLDSIHHPTGRPSVCAEDCVKC
jgi:hypothetical protein